MMWRTMKDILKMANALRMSLARYGVDVSDNDSATILWHAGILVLDEHQRIVRHNELGCGRFIKEAIPVGAAGYFLYCCEECELEAHAERSRKEAETSLE